MDELKLEGVLSRGYGIIPKLVVKDRDLSIESKAIYAYLCSYAGAGDTAFPSVGLICNDLDISEKRFHKHKNQLVDKGYIKIARNRKDSGFSNNVYTIAQVVTGQNVTLQNVSKQNVTRQSVTLQNGGTNNNSSNNNNINNNNNNNSRNSGKPKYDDESPYYHLANELLALVRNNNPEAKEPNLQTWADDMRKAIELDGRDIEIFRSVMKWSQKDTFWKGNILSAKKLREKYDQLRVQAGNAINTNNASNGKKMYEGIEF